MKYSEGFLEPQSSVSKHWVWIRRYCFLMVRPKSQGIYIDTHISDYWRIGMLSCVWILWSLVISELSVPGSLVFIWPQFVHLSDCTLFHSPLVRLVTACVISMVPWFLQRRPVWLACTVKRAIPRAWTRRRSCMAKTCGLESCDTAVRTEYVLPVTSPVSLLTQTFCTVHTVHIVCSPFTLVVNHLLITIAHHIFSSVLAEPQYIY